MPKKTVSTTKKPVSQSQSAEQIVSKRGANGGKGISPRPSDSTTVCPICLDTIIDASDKSDGQDSVYCDGLCKGWIHRRCAGLSVAAFSTISSSSNSDPFFCPHCRLECQNQEIASLKASVAQLTESVCKLQQALDPAAVCTPAHTCMSQPPSNLPSTVDPPASQHPYSTSPHNSIKRARPDRKYNLVVYGMKENEKGTKRHIRSANDIEAATTILSSLHSSITEYSVIDCIRLGKYSEDRCRPTLVTMNRPNDVSTVLVNRVHLSQTPHISIKPDLSPVERKVESILLKERRNLILSGTPRHHIKIRKDSLFINDREYGRVVDFTFLLCPLVSDFVPDASIINTSTEANHDQLNLQPGTSHSEATSCSADNDISLSEDRQQPHTHTSQ